jgi:hypothetical protein
MSTATVLASAAFGPTGYLIAQIAERALESTKDDSSKKSLEELQLLAKKQDIQMQMAEAQARVAQELAIAKRIEIAEEVEIEEFYDVSGKGDLGVKTAEGTLAVGASASGRKVTKRIYKFKGVHAGLGSAAEKA